MDSLIVYPKPDKYKKPRFGFSYEMLTIATVLSQVHKVHIKDYSCQEYDQDKLLEYIKQHKIELALIECDSYALKRSQNVIHAKKVIDTINPYVKTIAYGNYCSITKKDFANATYTIYQNNLNQIIEHINQLDPTKSLTPIHNFDELPYINRDLLLDIPYYKEQSQNTLLQTSKGCENTCVFCQRKGWQSCYITHSDDYVLGELSKIKEKGFKNVWITDENFTFNLPRAKRLTKKIIQSNLHENLRFFISSWANIDEEFLNLAKECNIKIISFGIESGNPEILRFYRKNIKLDKVPHIIQYANSIGIFTVGNFIIGAPQETEETIKQTFDLIKQCGFDQVNIKNLDYMIGSSLYESLEEQYKTEDHVFACAEKGLTNFKLAQIKEIKDNFLAEYYQWHKKAIEQKIKQYGSPF